MILSHIVAAAKNGTIGKNNDLPWNIPEDFKFFKDMTMGRCMILGRKNYESMPGGKALPGRHHIVISRSEDFRPSDAVVVRSFEEALIEAQKVAGRPESKFGEEIFVIGGGQVYEQTLERMDRIYLTLIHKDFEGDVTYPVEKVLTSAKFTLVSRRDKAGPPPFSFLTFKKS